ncbi:MAG: D-alanyl-D-alanine carboxypeptidase [Saprospiraceae bacterium]|nr:D-alanyl-D-alanine carboxypeptidase [Saprospiraceae bacterium]
MYLYRSSLFVTSMVILNLFTSCGSAHHTTEAKVDLSTLIEHSQVFNNHFTGFSLYDPVIHKTLYAYNDQKYFTPASNTKILTFYTALSFLPDPLPAFKYMIHGDSLIIKGMGDPTLLHPLWPQHPGLSFIINSDKRVFIVTDALQDEAMGDGWAWDDYSYYYQAEKSALPMYGNLIRIEYDSLAQSHKVFPAYFQGTWSNLTGKSSSNPYYRMQNDNDFRINVNRKTLTYIPFKTDAATINNLLSDTIHRSVRALWSAQVDPDSTWVLMPGVSADSVYAQMMKVSDNFIAEQLLLETGAYILDTLNTTKAIQYAKTHLFQNIPDPLQWVDGSGLSRYNLFTPRSIIYVLEQIYHKISEDRIKSIFPGGGVSGTLQTIYGAQTPYIYAKTGSLMNNYALSGYLFTKSGKILIFSFMHSNYTGSVMPIREEMQKTLEFVRDHY